MVVDVAVVVLVVVVVVAVVAITRLQAYYKHYQEDCRPPHLIRLYLHCALAARLTARPDFTALGFQVSESMVPELEKHIGCVWCPGTFGLRSNTVHDHFCKRGRGRARQRCRYRGTIRRDLGTGGNAGAAGVFLFLPRAPTAGSDHLPSAIPYLCMKSGSYNRVKREGGMYPHAMQVPCEGPTSVYVLLLVPEIPCKGTAPLAVSQMPPNIASSSKIPKRPECDFGPR